MRFYILLGLLVLAGCISFNINDQLNSKECDLLASKSSDPKLITSCYLDQATLYAVAGDEKEALKSCAKLATIHYSPLKDVGGIGQIVFIPIEYLYNIYYPVWNYKSCVIMVAKITRDENVCSYIGAWDHLLEQEDIQEIQKSTTELIGRKAISGVISGPQLAQSFYPGLTALDCKEEVRAVKARDAIATKSFFDIVES